MVLLDAGFLLSFGATLGILAWRSRGRAAARTGRIAAAACRSARSGSCWRTTVAAEAALLPISAMLFGRVTLAGLILNFVAIPLMSVLQAASMAALAVSTVSTRGRLRRAGSSRIWRRRASSSRRG